VVEPRGSLAIGITEPNPNFFISGPVPEPFARWRDSLLRLRPSVYRITIHWASLQPARGRAPDFAQHQPGCMRAIQPCAPWNGLRAQLEALAERQREAPGRWQGFAVIFGTPEWAAAPAAGCERSGTMPLNRPPADLEAYQSFVRSVQALARQVGARIRYWSPWNEPNHPYFIAAQRATCSERAASLAPAAYAPIARAMRATLEPGERLVLGELAGLTERTSASTTVQEFAAALPRDVVCSAGIWGQHLYVDGKNAVAAVAPALRRHGCRRSHEIWITETGLEDKRDCRALHRALVRWYEDPRVTAAIQYTLREDDAYPVGLVSTDLTRPFAALKEWQAWGGSGRPDPAQPPPESQCGR
jgi:hypothetical protein